MNKHREPILSIGLPVYNGENYLAETIDSLLDQTFDDFELVIADNASTDSTLEICEKYAAQDARIRILKSDVNKGAAWNFNRTFLESSGRYFKWAAHDDLHAREFLSHCVDVLEKNSDVVLAFTRTEFIDDNGASLGEHDFVVDLETATKRTLFRSYARGGHIVHEVFGVVRRDALGATGLIGGYVGSDLIMLGRLALTGKFVQVPKLLFYHREHPNRSAIVTGGNQDFTHWYDSSKTGRFAMPRWKRILESSKSVVCYPMSMSDRRAHFYDICRVAYWDRSMLLEDILQVFRRR